MLTLSDIDLGYCISLMFNMFSGSYTMLFDISKCRTDKQNGDFTMPFFLVNIFQLMLIPEMSNVHTEEPPTIVSVPHVNMFY